MGKLFDALVYTKIILYLEANQTLNPLQFGFRRHRSTFQALDKLVRDVLQAFEEKIFAQATLCDLSKALDCVDFSDLVIKLK